MIESLYDQLSPHCPKCGIRICDCDGRQIRIEDLEEQIADLRAQLEAKETDVEREHDRANEAERKLTALQKRIEGATEAWVILNEGGIPRALSYDGLRDAWSRHCGCHATGELIDAEQQRGYRAVRILILPADEKEEK